MTEMPQGEPPEGTELPPFPHLAGARQAAAAARSMAERIRDRNAHLRSGPARSPAQKLQTTPHRALAIFGSLPHDDPRAPRPGKGRPPRPSFARTIEAAKLWMVSTSPDGELGPWYPSLRPESDTTSWSKGWLTRIFRRRAGRRESAVAPAQSPNDDSHHAATAADHCATIEPPQRGATTGTAATRLQNGPTPDRDALASRRNPPPAADLREKPVPRLPSLHARQLRWEELSRELPNKTEHEAERWHAALSFVASRRFRLAGTDAGGRRGLGLGSAARSLIPVAPLAALSRKPIAATRVTLEGVTELPVPVLNRAVIRCSTEGFARFGPELPSAAPAERATFDLWGATKQLLVIGIAVLSGLTLCVLANDGALFSGFNLGRLTAQLDQLRLPTAADAPSASRTSADAETAPRSVSTDTGVASRSARDEGRIAALAATTSASDDRVAGVDRSKDASQSVGGSAASTDWETGLTRDREDSASTGARTAGGPPSALSWAALYARGHQAQSEGDFVAAINWYRQAASLNPDHPAILYDLGYMLQVRGDIDGAIDKYRRVIKLDPNHAYAQYDLGFLLQKKGNNKEAMAQYEKAARLSPANPYVYFDWARILESENDLARAKTLYQKAAELSPRRRPGTDARRRLAALNAETGR
jgi:Flp pilus assembly protein TadD